MVANNPENMNNPDIEVTKIVQVTFQEKIETMWLTREDIWEEEFINLEKRYLENLPLYQRWPDLNIHKLQERVNTGSLSKFQKIEALKDAMNQAEEKSNSILAEAENKAKELVEYKQSEMISVYAKKVEDWPMVWGLLKYMFSATEKLRTTDSPDFITKMVWDFSKFILGYFGYKQFENDFNGVKLTTPKVETNLWADIANNVKDTIIEPIDRLSKKEISTDVLYSGGINLLISLSWKKIEENWNKKSIFENLKNESYENLMIIKVTESKKNDILWEDYESETQKKLLNSTLDALTSEKSKILLWAWIKSNILENVIFNKWEIKDNLARHFWETIESWKSRLEVIYNESQKSDFNWKKLSLKELSILYIKSVPAFSLPSNNIFQEHKSDINALMSGWENEIKNTMDSIIPGSVVLGFIEKLGRNMWWDVSLKTKKDKEIFEDISKDIELESDKESIKDIIKFKNDIYKVDAESDFVNNEKLNLTPQQKEMFNANLNYKWVMALYSVLGWNTDLNNINPITLPILVLTISHIIWDWAVWNKQIGADYLGSYTKNALKWTDNVFLTDEERDIMEIYWDKVVDVVYFSYLKEFYSNLGLISWVSDDLWLLALEAFGGWFILNKLWNRKIKKGIEKWSISVLWKILKKAWWLGMIFWGLIGTVEILSKKWFKVGSFESDINKSIENGSIEEAIKILDKHKESTQEYYKDWEKITLVSYEGDTPYAFYKWKVWYMNTIDLSWNISNIKWIEWVASYSKKVLYDLIFATKTSIVDGVDVNKIKMQDRKIILWEWKWSLVVDLEESIPNWKEENFIDLFKKIKDSVKDISEEEWDLEYLNWTEMFYIPIKDLWWWRYLSLVEVGEEKK